MPHRDTSNAIKQAITQALNATQGHKHWLSIKPLINLYNLYPILGWDLNPHFSTGVHLLYTVIIQDVHIYRISKDRYNVVKLSPHMFISWMYIFKRDYANNVTYSFETQFKRIMVLRRSLQTWMINNVQHSANLQNIVSPHFYYRLNTFISLFIVP